MTRRVCMLLPAHCSALMGGAEYQAKLLAEHLVKNYDVEISYLTTRSDPDYRAPGYEIVRFSTHRGIRRYGTFFDAYRLYRALDRLKPDIIYQQVGCAHTGIAAFYALRNDCTMVWRVSSDRSVVPTKINWWRRPHHWIERAFLEYGIKRAHVVLAQTRAQQGHLAARFGRDDALLVQNFHLEVPEPVRRNDLKRVVWIGNLKVLKNPQAFVRLAQRYSDRPDVELVMIGATSDSTSWTNEALDLIRSTANLKYLGALTQEQVNAELESARVLVNTSDYEGFPNTFIQAWLRGVPVVSLHADPDALLSAEGLGLVSHTEEQLYANVTSLLEAPELAKRMGERCRAYGVRSHSMANADRVARILRLSCRESCDLLGELSCVSP